MYMGHDEHGCKGDCHCPKCGSRDVEVSVIRIDGMIEDYDVEYCAGCGYQAPKTEEEAQEVPTPVAMIGDDDAPF